MQILLTRLQDRTAFPDGSQATPVTGAAWSVNVTKQKPLASDHTLTCVKWTCNMYSQLLYWYPDCHADLGPLSKPQHRQSS